MAGRSSPVGCSPRREGEDAIDDDPVLLGLLGPLLQQASPSVVTDLSLSFT